MERMEDRYMITKRDRDWYHLVVQSGWLSRILPGHSYSRSLFVKHLIHTRWVYKDPMKNPNQSRTFDEAYFRFYVRNICKWHMTKE